MTKEKWLALPPHKGHVLSQTGYKKYCYRCIALFGGPPKEPAERDPLKKPTARSIYQAWTQSESEREANSGGSNG